MKNATVAKWWWRSMMTTIENASVMLSNQMVRLRLKKIVGQCFPNAKAVQKRYAYDETKISRKYLGLKKKSHNEVIGNLSNVDKSGLPNKDFTVEEEENGFQIKCMSHIVCCDYEIKKHLHFFWSNSFHGCFRYSYPTGRTWYLVIIACLVKWKHICFTEKYSDFRTVSAWFTMEHLSSDIQVVTWSVSYFYQAALH